MGRWKKWMEEVRNREETEEGLCQEREEIPDQFSLFCSRQGPPVVIIGCSENNTVVSILVCCSCDHKQKGSGDHTEVWWYLRVPAASNPSSSSLMLSRALVTWAASTSYSTTCTNSTGQYPILDIRISVRACSVLLCHACTTPPEI